MNSHCFEIHFEANSTRINIYVASVWGVVFTKTFQKIHFLCLGKTLRYDAHPVATCVFENQAVERYLCRPTCLCTYLAVCCTFGVHICLISNDHKSCIDYQSMRATTYGARDYPRDTSQFQGHFSRTKNNTQPMHLIATILQLSPHHAPIPTCSDGWHC